MCGIAGYISREPRSGVLSRMTRRLAHRGPDGEGHRHFQRDGWHVMLGHRRLSIIDLAGGAQPLCNENQQVWITYNGEIYNYPDLRPRLEGQGHRFATHCDTEAIVHLLEQHGREALAQLDGMFAFALWDHEQGTLLLARDRAGIKPLYYASLPDGGIAFASELTALLEHPDISRALCPQGLGSYLFSDSIPPPDTILKQVRKLPPGTSLRWRDGRDEQPLAFWSLRDVRPRADEGRPEELAIELWERLRRAVTAQLLSDVPVGIFLSGGIDSSSVAALAQAAAGQPMRTFCIAFEEPQYDESAYARLMAQRLGTQHIEQTLRASALVEHMDKALDCLDEPMADPSIVPTYLLSGLAASSVKVVLGGDGGDETWGGYPTYRAHRYARLFAHLPAVIRKGLIAPAVRRLPVREGYQSLEWKLKRFVLRWDDDPLWRHLRWMSSVDATDLETVMEQPSWSSVWRTLRDPLFTDPLNAVLALDFRTYMSGSILAKVDRASMAHGLEVRPPLLSNDLIEWSFSLPSSLKVSATRSKILLKRAAMGHLPSSILGRKKKGFGIPLAQWLRGPLRERLESVLRQSPLWDMAPLRHDVFTRWKDEHCALAVDRSKPLWSLIVLDHWARRIASFVHHPLTDEGLP